MVVAIEKHPKWEVSQFCKDNNISYTWDFNKFDGKWTEILLEGELIMQISNTATKDSFVKLMKLLEKNFKTKEISFDDNFWFTLTKSEKRFKEFMKKHKNAFIKKRKNGKKSIHKR